MPDFLVPYFAAVENSKAQLTAAQAALATAQAAITVAQTQCKTDADALVAAVQSHYANAAS